MLDGSQKTFLGLRWELYLQDTRQMVCPSLYYQAGSREWKGIYVLPAFYPTHTLFSSKQTTHYNIPHFRDLIFFGKDKFTHQRIKNHYEFMHIPQLPRQTRQ